jgi:hypothetical protein
MNMIFTQINPSHANISFDMQNLTRKEDALNAKQREVI